MPRVCLLDPSITSREGAPSNNLGDSIIRQAVVGELSELLPGWDWTFVPTQLPMTAEEMEKAVGSDLLVVGGTNLLSSQMQQYKQWQISMQDARSLNRVVLMGVGWWQYQDAPDAFTASILRSALSSSLPQSLRDRYSCEKLVSIGLENTVNTGCPTMWRLTPELLSRTPVTKADRALVMLTDYNKDRNADRALIELALSHYREVCFWPQGSQDARYICELVSGFDRKIAVVERSMTALDQLLQESEPIDYIGTRLHGGIRCMQQSRRALVLGIDNRATEIASDTGLKVIPRKDLPAIQAWIAGSQPVEIRLNYPDIAKWKNALVDGLLIASGTPLSDFTTQRIHHRGAQRFTESSLGRELIPQSEGRLV